MSDVDDGHAGARPALPIAVEAVEWKDWSEGVRFGGRVQRLGDAAGASRIGVLLEELPPGKQSAPLHWHTHEEEHIWFLAGRATLRMGDERIPVAAGDYVCFPAGRALGHCLINDSDEPCRYLVIGERSPDDACIYPDSGKMLIRAAGRTLVRLPTSAIDYWEGERTDEPPV